MVVLSFVVYVYDEVWYCFKYYVVVNYLGYLVLIIGKVIKNEVVLW